MASRIFGVSHSGAINTISGFTNDGRLHAANSAASTHDATLANVAWYMGPEEANATYTICYTVLNAESLPTTFNSIGDQGTDGTPGTPNTAYISFKQANNEAEYLQAWNHIATLNGQEQTFARVTDAHTWGDNNIDYWTNFTVVESTTTAAPTYFYYNWQECNNGANTGSIRSDVALNNGDAYNVASAVLGAGVEVPSNVIVITGSGDEGITDITITGAPVGATCGATP